MCGIVGVQGDFPADLLKKTADEVNQVAESLKAHKMRVGYHNHNAEFMGAKGQRPIDLIAKNTKSSVVLQLDVGTCLEAGGDPVEWIKGNPGRIRSIHCKDWSPDQGYKELFGEGVADWKNIFETAESVGGVEYYLIEQEGSRYSEFDTARKCLEAFRGKHRA